MVIENAIKKLKNNKSPGKDTITCELLKHAGNTVTSQLHELIITIWKDEKIPEDWKESIIIALHKKEDRGNNT